MRLKLAVGLIVLMIGSLLLAACSGSAATNVTGNNSGPSATLPPVAETAIGAVGTTVTGSGDLATLGKMVYTENCAACHGANGEGGSGPSLTNNPLVTGAPEALIDFILTGKNGSHAFAEKLTDQQIAAVLTHIRANLSTPAGQVTEDQVKPRR